MSVFPENYDYDGALSFIKDVDEITVVVFQLLFSHFGEDVVQLFLSHANKHVATTLEPSQRFAAEVASAALRAPRYWTRPRQSQLYRDVLQLIKAGIRS